jgi:hypothetical protein
MKNLGIRLSAATGLAVASIGLASLMSVSPAVNQADQGCPYDWVYDTYWGHCHPPGLPSFASRGFRRNVAWTRRSPSDYSPTPPGFRGPPVAVLGYADQVTFCCVLSWFTSGEDGSEGLLGGTSWSAALLGRRLLQVTATSAAGRSSVAALIHASKVSRVQ